MPRVEIPLIGPSYTNREKPLSAQVAKNLWPEINPEARNQVALHNTAGIRTFATLSGVDRGMTDFNNLMYAVSGQTLYSIDAEGTNFALGTIAGTDRVVMANDSLQLIIVTGDIPYKYTVANGVEEITDPDLVKPTTVAYLNNQFIFDQNAGVFGEFVTSSVDPDFSVDALDFAQAESHPDDIIAIVAFRQLVYMFGSHSVEPWQNTGVGNPPFARVNSGVQPYGLAGLHGITKTDEFMYYLDTKRIPRRSNGLNHLNIGNPALGVEFAKYSKIDDVIAFDFVQDNQQFVAFTFPTANRTWCFHEPSGSWFQLVSGIGNDRHRASSMMHMYGLNYCADHTNGLLYEYSLDIYSDNGEPIIKQRDTAVIHGGLFGVPGKKLFYDEVEFIIVAGETEVAGTGLGPQPVIPGGVCGTTSDLTQGQLLATGSIQEAFSGGIVQQTIIEAIPSTNNVLFTDSKSVCGTFAIVRSAEPDSTFTVSVMELYDTVSVFAGFEANLDENGYINFIGRNSSGTLILDVQISNLGSTFADSNFYLFGFVFNMDNEENREIYLNNQNITNSIYTTWNTYTDDTLSLANGDNMTYYFGGGNGGSWASIANLNGGGLAGGTDSITLCSFDDTCSLVSSAIWDSDGWVRDPQAWEGWYASQPQVFYATSFWMNSGRTAPDYYRANKLELSLEQTLFDAYIQDIATGDQIDATVINLGISGDISANETATGTLPPAPGPDPQTEIVAPFWESTGNWIDLSKLTNTTFESMFGVAIENADFNKVVAVDKAALVNTSDSGNRIQIQDTADCSNAAMYITDSSGNVIQTMLYFNEPTGKSVLVPTGANYYVVISSDTVSAKIKKWDTTQISTVGSVSWESFFGVPLSIGRILYDDMNPIPRNGTSIAFTAPNTSQPYVLSFTVIENTTTANTTATGSVNQTVGDYTSAPTFLWGQGTGIRCGINSPGHDIDLIPGETYFFNVRNDTPNDANFIHIQAVLVAQ